MVASPAGWRLAALPVGARNATVDEAVAAFIQALDQRDPDAMLILLGAQRDGVAREIAQRAEAVRVRRGSTETSGGKARVRIADSWWLLIEATPAGWRVIGAEP